MLHQIEFTGRAERIRYRERCLGPAGECLNPVRRNTL